MSASPSPKPSFESEERPESSESMEQVAGTSHKRNVSFEDNPKKYSPRRRSIQFQVAAAEPQLPSRPPEKGVFQGDTYPGELEAEKDQRSAQTVRGPSPPPPKTYERGVSFNTFDNRDAPNFSLTLNYKHKGYQSTRRSRSFLVGTDQSEYSELALAWLLDELVDDGDEIVCLRVVEKDSRMASDAGIEEGKYRQEANRLFEQVIRKNSQNQKAISLVLELTVGKAEDIIQRMIRIYEPVMLVVGTRGRNLKGVHSLLPGSVSKYCLQQSPIPVIVVRPSPKRQEKKKKRRADPTRKSYNHILNLSEKRGSRIFDTSSSTEDGISKLPDEKAAVAEALGLPASYSHAKSRSSLSVSDRSSLSHDESDSPSPSSASHALDTVVMKSPIAGSLASSEESVALSEDTERPGRPPTPAALDEPDEEASDDNDSTSKGHDGTDSRAATPDPANPVSIPTIEVSNDNDEKAKTEDK